MSKAERNQLMQENGIESAIGRVMSATASGIAKNITNNLIKVLDNLIRFNSDWSGEKLASVFGEDYVISYKNNVLAEREFNAHRDEEDIKKAEQSARAQHSNTKTPYIAEIFLGLSLDREATLALTNPYLTQEDNDKLESVGNRKKRLKGFNDSRLQRENPEFAEAKVRESRAQEALDVARAEVEAIRDAEVADRVPSLDFSEAFETVKVTKFTASGREYIDRRKAELAL